MKSEARYPEFFGVKVPADVAAEIRRRAREDDRTVSGYLRRLLVAALRAGAPLPTTSVGVSEQSR